MTELDDTIRELVREAYVGVRPPVFDVQAGLADMRERIEAAESLSSGRQVERSAQVTFTASGDSWYDDLPGAQPRTASVSADTVDDLSWTDLQGSDRYAACLRAARAGNRAALATLVEDLTPLVWHVARGNELDRTAAEEVVQTVWLALLRHLNKLTEPRALAGWLITTTRREAQRMRGRTTRQPRLLDEVAVALVDPSAQPEELAVRSDRNQRLWQAFTRLPTRCQELLRLTVLAGRAEYRMVAEALHMPRGSIGPTRGRCLSTLRELLEFEGGDA